MLSCEQTLCNKDGNAQLSVSDMQHLSEFALAHQ